MITDRESRLFQDGLFALDLNAYVPGTVTPVAEVLYRVAA